MTVCLAQFITGYLNCSLLFHIGFVPIILAFFEINKKTIGWAIDWSNSNKNFVASRGQATNNDLFSFAE